MTLSDLREQYHRAICQKIIRVTGRGSSAYYNFADSGNRSSIQIASQIVRQLGFEIGVSDVTGQNSGTLFEDLTADFLQEGFSLLSHLRPGDFTHGRSRISNFAQYSHLADLLAVIKDNRELKAVLGTEYIITPDLVIGRKPVSDVEINSQRIVLDVGTRIAHLTDFRSANSVAPQQILHASISCKWTIRSDRVQNSRTEALNLIRNRKGNLPHIVVVTAEPLPTRIASLALGTGDIDCVYHFALYEMQEAVRLTDNIDQQDILSTMVEGHRLRDISDLPFDLAV